VDGQIKAQRKSKTVIVENISADLGLSANELKTWFLEQLQDRFISAVTIESVDVISLAPTNAVQVNLGDFDMLEQFTKIDGVTCLGKPIRVRKADEETTLINAQAKAATVSALQSVLSI